MPVTEPYPIHDFLDYLKFQKRYSENTIISYQNDLSSFFEFLVLEYKITDVKEITASIVRTWLASLKENKCSSKTVNRKISALKSFFKYQLKIENLSKSPVAAIASLKVSKKLPSFIQEKDMDTLLKHDYFPETFAGKTNFLIFEILYQTGIRRNELIHLKESDIDKSSGLIKVLGKGNKERFIPVSNQLLKMIDEYIAEKKKEIAEVPDDFLLVNKKGKKLDPKYIYNIVKKNLSSVSTNERKSPHILRHTFATHLTNNGAEINAIKELLGHRSLASTQIYTNNSIEKLKEVYKQAHPKSE
ncbi:MAG TPA: tyrosine-type recombinase/integrase [Hanamia sp.]|jgi:integrase/recombinase XerC|nr:tyrosine-type recombinase/integrase [Hanamia sp.]